MLFRTLSLCLLATLAASETLFFKPQHVESHSAVDVVVKAQNVVCPDGQSQCPDGSTCCKLASGQYGCCPIPQAVCCSDQVHCCPSGTTCDVSQGKCNRGEESTPLLKKIPSQPRTKVENVVCPDGQSQCPDGSTCCKLASGQYGCCPIPQAVCCSDQVHCCPSGTTCDVSQGKCNRGEESSPLLKKFPSQPRTQVENVVCPDGQSQCPDGSTCCKLASGQYGCCPIPQAVCCSDQVHCCPSGTTCDVSQGKCNRGEESTPWLKKQPSQPRTQVENVVCPDGQSQCPDGSTCCKLASGQYGCCPLPQAVCCSDQVHCCPSGTTCDVSQGKCNRGEESSPLLKKFPSQPRTQVENVVCPDGQSQCPDGSTCCKLASGQYGCCPIPQAVCCSDQVHCCPSGTTCDVSQGKCNRGEESTPLLKKNPSQPRTQVENVVCPDGQSQCPDGSTCCKLASGQYGCCPIPQAVCCSDQVHCCPSGTTCDVSQGKCNRGEESTPLLKKFPSQPRTRVENVVCPDGQSQCPDGSTCCKLASGQYGCCPLPQAVCCSDQVHCCPSGTTCDVSQGKCNRGEESTPWLKKQPSQPRTQVENVVCPDGQSQCPDGSTCCKLASGQYGCCPIPQAVCCSDQVHCCPSGTTCDVSQGKCNRGEESTPWLKKQPSQPRTQVENVVCPDGQSQCPDGSTCCKLASGQYGCCPIPQAVCCSDQVHCCPSGTTCDVSQGKCNRGEESTPWLKKQPSQPRTQVENVVCPDGQSQCPDGSTCCKLASGQYGCCPLPQAVCCSDQVHCCPSGTTCDVSQGKCNRGEESTPWLKKQPSQPRTQVENVVCPDGQSQCPDGSTCCKLASGQYGCCPIPQAVCCSDQVHCCPSGTTCDVSQGKCNRGLVSMPWLKKMPHSAIVKVNKQP